MKKQWSVIVLTICWLVGATACSTTKSPTEPTKESLSSMTTGTSASEKGLEEAIALLDAGKLKQACEYLLKLSKHETGASQVYDKAMQYLEIEDYERAFVLLKNLDYKDSREKLQNVLDRYPGLPFKQSFPGDIVTFGKYECDNDETNGKEDIHWEVLEKEENRVLVICCYAVDHKPYNDFIEKVTWETCSLREWMNHTFLQEAFSDTEQLKIQSVTVPAERNPYYDTDPGNNTADKLFLLSATEVKTYFKTDESRQCSFTPWADYLYNRGVGCAWWLRTPGCRFNEYDENNGVYVGSLGEINYSGGAVTERYSVGVRPAMWIAFE